MRFSGIEVQRLLTLSTFQNITYHCPASRT